MSRRLAAALTALVVGAAPFGAAADGVTYYDGATTTRPGTGSGVQQQDIGRIAAGLATAFIIGKLIDNALDDDDDDRDRARARDRDDRFYDERRDRDRRIYRYEGRDDRYRDGRHDRSRRDVRGTIPRECLREVQTRRGLERVVGRYCLERSDVRISRLPGHCATRVETRRGVFPVYSPRCLRRNGWHIG